MPIRYALYENNITSDPDDYAAIVQIAGSLDLDARADSPLRTHQCPRVGLVPWSPCPGIAE